MAKRDRAQGPSNQWPATVSFPRMQREELPNGLPCYTLLGGQVPAMQLMLVFPNGRYSGDGRMVSQAVFGLLDRATAHHDKQALPLALDSMGSRCKPFVTSCFSGEIILCSADRLLPSAQLLYEMATECAFSQPLLDVWADLQLKSIGMRQQQPRYLASLAVRKALLPSGHPYIDETLPSQVEAVTLDAVQDFYRRRVGSRNARLFIMGQAPAPVLERVKMLFGATPWGLRPDAEEQVPDVTPVDGGLVQVLPSPQDEQAALCLGRTLPLLPAEATIELDIALTLLGGFLGSRLMQNLRERRGLTYGVSARLSPMRRCNAVYIEADLSNNNAALAVQEIRVELQRMREQPAGAEELARMKAYALGRLLAAHDGVMRAGSYQVRRELFDFAPTYDAASYISVLGAITAERIQAVSAQWLDPAAFSVCVAGNVEAIGGISW